MERHVTTNHAGAGVLTCPERGSAQPGLNHSCLILGLGWRFLGLDRCAESPIRIEESENPAKSANQPAKAIGCYHSDMGGSTRHLPLLAQPELLFVRNRIRIGVGTNSRLRKFPRPSPSFLSSSFPCSFPFFCGSGYLKSPTRNGRKVGFPPRGIFMYVQISFGCTKGYFPTARIYNPFTSSKPLILMLIFGALRVAPNRALVVNTEHLTRNECFHSIFHRRKVSILCFLAGDYSGSIPPPPMMDSKRVELLRKASLTVPVGPLRCLRMISSATPSNSGSSGL